jgi:hypothetical protein
LRNHHEKKAVMITEKSLIKLIMLAGLLVYP